MNTDDIEALGKVLSAWAFSIVTYRMAIDEINIIENAKWY